MHRTSKMVRYLLVVILTITSVIAADLDISALNKPKGVKALAWLQQLEDERDKAELNHNFNSFEALSREISATLAGKYGFANRVARPNERQLMLGSVMRTRNYFAGRPGSLNDFYFGYDKEGCWKRMEANQTFARHMAIIIAADAMHFGVKYNKFGELLNNQRRQLTVDQNFVDVLERITVYIHADKPRLNNLVTSILPANLKRLVDDVVDIVDRFNKINKGCAAQTQTDCCDLDDTAAFVAASMVIEEKSDDTPVTSAATVVDESLKVNLLSPASSTYGRIPFSSPVPPLDSPAEQTVPGTDSEEANTSEDEDGFVNVNARNPRIEHNFLKSDFPQSQSEFILVGGEETP